MTLPWYVTRESVKEALDYKETARNNAQVDRAIESASRAVEGLLHRRFYPWTGTRYFDWPNAQYARSWRLWLDDNELISVTTLASGGVTIDSADFILRRSDDKDEAPYSFIELDLDTSAAFGQGSTWQRDIAITGQFGYDDTTEPAGALNGAIDSSQTTVTVTDSSAVGVGDLIAVGTERMVVTDKRMVDTSVAFAGLTTATASDDTLTVPDGTAFAIGEVLRFDTERALVVDIADNDLVLRRAWDGSRLAAHTSGNIYADRKLTVTRGALGTTAASHADAATVARHVPPGLVTELCLAYALNNLLQARSGYARVAGVKSGTSSEANAIENTGRGISGVERDACRAYGRKARTRAV